MDCGGDGDAELTSSASAVLRGRHRQVKVSSDETMTISTSKGLVSGSNVHDDEKKQSAKLKCCCRFVADERRYGLQHTTGWLKCRQRHGSHRQGIDTLRRFAIVNPLFSHQEPMSLRMPLP